MRARKTTRRSASSVITNTRERVLDVAEQLFAQRGLDAVSIRDITSAASVNLGAINYHFRTKEKLISEVIARRIHPLTNERLCALERLERAGGNPPPTLEAVLEVIFRPAVEQSMDPKRGGTTFGKLMARCLVEPHPAVEAVLRTDFDEVVKRFDTALMRVMPELTAEDVFWRMHLLIGALHQSLLMMDRPLPDGRRLCLDADTYVRRFVAFAAAGFRADLPPKPEPRKK